MKVRYVNVLPTKRNPELGYIIDPNEDMTLGRIYAVFSIEVQLSGLGYVTIQYDSNMVNRKEIQLFEVIDPAIPDNWVISISKNNYYRFEPKVFFEFPGDFWEHYYCNDNKAEGVFEQERKRLEVFHAQRNCSLQIPSSLLISMLKGDLEDYKENVSQYLEIYNSKCVNFIGKSAGIPGCR
jgi:hypothetical protein